MGIEQEARGKNTPDPDRRRPHLSLTWPGVTVVMPVVNIFLQEKKSVCVCVVGVLLLTQKCMTIG